MFVSLQHMKQHAIEAADAIPLPVVFALTVPMPLWKFYLDKVSDYAHVAASVFGVALALLKGWALWKESREARATAAQGLATAAATAAKAGTRAPGLLAALLAGLGVLALVAWLSPSANASPAVAANEAAVKGRKRKASDDAGGEDVDEPAEVPDGAPKWLIAAYGDLGVREKLSNGRANPIVSEYFEHTQLGKGVDPRRVPWCAAWINAKLEDSGYVGSKSAMARSLLRWGVALETPRLGCVAVVWRPTEDKPYDDGTTGHVFFYLREDARYVYGIGGNQSDAVTESRFLKSRVLGYRWPRSATRSVTNIGAATSAGSSSGLVGIETTKEILPPPSSSPVPAGATEAAQDAIEQLQGPLHKVAGFIHGKPGQYLMIALAVLSVSGALLALYGRLRVRNEHGI